MPARTRLQRERERRAAESPDAREIRLQRCRQRRAARLHLQATDKPHWGRKGSGLELGEPVLKVTDKPHLAYALPTMLCIHLDAERLSVRQLIVQCGLKSQLAYIIYIYIYMCATSVTLRNAIKSLVTFLIRVITMSVRSVYALLLRL